MLKTRYEKKMTYSNFISPYFIFDTLGYPLPDGHP